ncbi:MAG: flagellar basal body P-ring protein FlgI [Spirochaetota bacterium]|nr:flagellar basal body P-ring protein FlgI [Spirochaetota bacterium]
MKVKINAISLCLITTVFLSTLAYSEISVKIRDIAFIDGLRANQVFGFGLVVGLQGTGDSKSTLIRSSLKNILNNLGLEEGENFTSKNVAAVLITAKLPPFIRVGDRIDITVSSIGDAKSLEGGILIQSPLKGADDIIYVVAQGALSIIDAKKRGKGIRTVAQIINGGVVEREIEPEIITDNSISLVLKEWDFTVADRIIKSVSKKYPESKPATTKGGRIRINLPRDVNIVELVSTVENIEITPIARARVVVNEKDGTIVMGEDVKISEVVVSKDGLTVNVEGENSKGNSALLKESSTVKDLMDSLNYIGVNTSEIISILKALKDAGALHADLIIR